MYRNITWKELTIRDVLRADYFENTISVYKDRNDINPLTITAEDYYMEENGIYVNPKNSENFDSIKNILEKAVESKLIFVQGYAGCGKSTMINKIFFDICKSINTDFSYKKYNYMLTRDCYNFNNGANTCINSNNEITSTIVNQLIDRIIYLYKSEDKNTFNHLYFTFKNIIGEYNFFSRFDKDHEIENRLVNAPRIRNLIKKIQNDGFEETNFRHELELQLSPRRGEENFNLNMILAIDFAVRLSQYLIIKDKTALYVCYDNLDAIDDLAVLQKFHYSIVVFITRVNKYFNTTIKMLRERYEVRNLSFFIFVTYRKITATRVHSQFNNEVIVEEAGDPSHIYEFDISDDYNYSDIIDAKVKFFMKFAKDSPDNLRISREMKSLSTLNTLKVLKNDYQSFWNNNFRGCADVLDNISSNQTSAIEAIIRLANQNEDSMHNILYTATKIYIGASSIFLRTIYNLFSNGDILDEKCLNLIPITQEGAYIDSCDYYHYTSLSRLILSFFYENGPCTIDKLFKAFSVLYTPEQIAMAIYPMLEKNNTWRRLLYYTDNALSNDNLRDNLLQQAKNYESKSLNNNYTELNLCLCGKEFVKTISTSFEFYACRCDSKSKSLFDLNNAKDIENTINMVLKAVENCCKRLIVFRDMFMKKSKKQSIDYFLGQPFNSYTHTNKRQLYEERIIFNHIAYLEGFRRYALKKRGESKKRKININKIMVKSIKNYLSLYFNYICTYDPQRKEVAEDLKGYADTIETSNYEDFETCISRRQKKNVEIKTLT